MFSSGCIEPKACFSLGAFAFMNPRVRALGSTGQPSCWFFVALSHSLRRSCVPCKVALHHGRCPHLRTSCFCRPQLAAAAQACGHRVGPELPSCHGQCLRCSKPLPGQSVSLAPQRERRLFVVGQVWAIARCCLEVQVSVFTSKSEQPKTMKPKPSSAVARRVCLARCSPGMGLGANTRANPSFELTRYGRRPCPGGGRFAHFPPPCQRRLPTRAAQFKR